jgi:excisionase family DNA binding protein
VSAGPDVLTVDEVAALLRIGRNSVYDGAARGEIPHRRVGRRLVFSRAALIEWLSCKPASPEARR